MSGVWGRTRARLRAAVGPLLGELRGTTEVDLGGAPAVCLCYDPGEALPLLRRAGPLRCQGPLPADLDPAAVGAEQGVARAVLVHPLRELRLLDALRAVRAGGREFHLVHAPGQACRAGATGALALAAARELERGLTRAPGAARLARAAGLRLAPWPSSSSTLHALEAVRAHARGRAVPPLPPGPPAVVHWVPSLPSGGAERQLVYLARLQAEAGARVRVLTSLPLEGTDAHYAPALREAGVEVRALLPWPRWRALPALHDAGGRPLPPALLEALAGHAAAGELLALLLELVRDPPAVLHGWLDEANATAGPAGLAAALPRVVLSTWNVNPSHFARLHKPWFRDSYRLLADGPRLRVSANSRAGGDDYAAWACFDPARVEVVPNGLSAAEWAPLTPAEVSAGRARLGIPPGAFLVGGVFRLDPEKRPHDFLEVLARVRAAVPELRAVHVGTGTLAAEVQARARALRLDEAVRFLGRVERPREALGLCDASLLTSAVEGSPNVSQESQLLEVPVILTRVVGSPETIRPGETGWTFPVSDLDGMAGALITLARDRERRRAMGRAGREWIAREFSLEALAARTETLYRGGGG